MSAANKRYLSIFFPEWNGDFETMTRLARWAYRFSPLVAVDPTAPASPDTYRNGLNLDISGSNRLLGDEQLFLDRIERALTRAGFKSRLAIAPTLGAAWAFSRYGTAAKTVIQPSELRRELASLPVAALRLSPETVLALREINIRKIEHLFQLSPKLLLPRFGLLLLKRIDQVLGREDEVIEFFKFTSPLKVERILDGVLTDFEALLQLTRLLLSELLAKLGESWEKVGAIGLEVKQLGQRPLSYNLTLSTASFNEKHIWSLLSQKLEQIDLGFGVEAVTLTAVLTESINFSQEEGLSEGRADRAVVTPKRWGEFLDTLSAQLGHENILRLETKETHIPEEVSRFVPLASKRARQTIEKAVLVNAERPSVLFSKPQLVQAMSLLPDSPPFWLRWKSETHKVRSGIGPERIAPSWWGRDEKLLQTRDYFKVQLPCGIWLWIFRELETSRWFVHGIWS